VSGHQQNRRSDTRTLDDCHRHATRALGPIRKEGDMDRQAQRVIAGAALVFAAISHAASASARTMGGTEVIVDNAQAEVTGAWTTSTYQPNYYATNYAVHKRGTGTDRIVWRPVLTTDGQYAVYCQLPNGAGDRAPDAVFTVHHATGTATVTVDERASRGGWTLLGTFRFVAGTAGFVDLTDRTTGTYVIADAIKFALPATESVDSTTPALREIVVDNDAATSAGTWSVSTSRPNFLGSNYSTRPSSGTGANWIRWTPSLPEAGRYAVYYRLPDGQTNRAPDARFEVTSTTGTQVVRVDERQASNGEWMSLGMFTFAAGTSGYVTLSDQATGSYVIADAIKFVRTDHTYTIRTDLRRQTILGLGVEVQADSIGSGNNGLPEKASGVPHDLTTLERTRFYQEMLKGFRYVRLAMGLYIRGLTFDGQNIVERYAGQLAELREMIQQSGIEGASVEYWSPGPAWKNTNSFVGGSLKQFDDVFLSDFSDSVVRDLRNLIDNGIPVTMFGLQNEPKASYSKAYSYTTYTDQQYYDAFRHVAPKVREAYPKVLIHNDSQGGQTGMGAKLIQADPIALSYIDAWTWHRIGTSADEQITDRLTFNSNRFDRPVFNNEFEYLSGGTSVDRMLNTAQSIMNWMTFENAPTWFWLHALKPTYNSEGEGYALGLWRPDDDDDFTKYTGIDKGHFDYVKTNWHAVAGFLKYMPWNSVRYHVDEGVMRTNQRIMAWRSPAGKLTIAVTNRSKAAFTFDIGLLSATSRFTGHRYDATLADVNLGSLSGAALPVTVPAYSIEFWVEN
jgi:O-glycosyl hydrolase